MNVAKNFVIRGIKWVFTIFIFMQNKGQKLNSGKINYSYLLNKIVVSHTST